MESTMTFSGTVFVLQYTVRSTWDFIITTVLTTINEILGTVVVALLAAQM